MRAYEAVVDTVRKFSATLQIGFFVRTRDVGAVFSRHHGYIIQFGE